MFILTPDSDMGPLIQVLSDTNIDSSVHSILLQGVEVKLDLTTLIQLSS